MPLLIDQPQRRGDTEANANRKERAFGADSDHALFGSSLCLCGKLALYAWLSSFRSHARANVHSLITVPGDTFNTSAVSSMLSPPKKRSSTISLCRESIV